jgi:aspartyl-tRNA(Asn)/glutamyl-tRNA(Gln) amidotransferase subunit C
MAITLETARAIARLANLDFTEEELSQLSLQLNAILDYVQKLDELDTSAIEPTSHIARLDSAFREDGATPSLPISQALANAPETREGHFSVPKVIG